MASAAACERPEQVQQPEQQHQQQRQQPVSSPSSLHINRLSANIQNWAKAQTKAEADAVRKRGGKVIEVSCTACGIELDEDVWARRARELHSDSLKTNMQKQPNSRQTKNKQRQHGQQGAFWHLAVLDTKFDFSDVTAVLVSENVVSVPDEILNLGLASQEKASLRFVVLDTRKKIPLLFSYILFGEDNQKAVLNLWILVNANGQEVRHKIDAFR